MHARGPAGHPHHPALQSRCPHEPRHPILAGGDALFAQGLRDPGASVGAVGAGMDVPDPFEELLIGPRSEAWPSMLPSVVATS